MSADEVLEVVFKDLVVGFNETGDVFDLAESVKGVQPGKTTSTSMTTLAAGA